MLQITPQSYVRTNNPKGLPVYNNLPKVKLGGIKEPLTQWELTEIQKCKQSPEYFIEKYITLDGESGIEKFELYEYQKDTINTLKEEKYTIILAPRRAGKSICILGYITWFAVFHSNKNVYVLSKTHDDSKGLLEKLKKMYEALPFFLQVGVSNGYGIEKIQLANGTKLITSSSKGVRGDDADILYCDEFSFLPNSQNFWAATYPVVAKRKKARVIITSTPDGMGNEFYNQWKNAEERKSYFIPIRWYWDEVPGYDEQFKKETIANTSLERWKTEFECEFLATSNTLIEGSVLNRLDSKDPIKIYDEKAYVYELPKEDGKYILTCDVADGVGKDYTVFTIIDISEKPYNVVAVYRDNKLSPFALDTLIVNWAKRYNNAYVVIETNQRGADVSHRILYDHNYENIHIVDPNKPSGLGIDMKEGIKKKGCVILKNLIEMDMLDVNHDVSILELKTFQKNARGGFEGVNGINDDTVMSLVLFAILTNDPIFIDLQGSDKDINETIASLRKSTLPQEFLLSSFSVGKSDPFNDINNIANFFNDKMSKEDMENYSYNYNSDWDYY